jgi:2-polyprenyl-6-methoxyphenol hydroxylase-like FAD-dependent oxidoreductase
MTRVAIIGGGIGGLTAANALSRARIEVAVYEAAGELKEIGAGVALHPAPICSTCSRAARVRESLFGPDAPRFTGKICYRSVVPAAAVPGAPPDTDNTQWLGPHGTIVLYPLRGSELINIVAHYDDEDYRHESWIAECDRCPTSARVPARRLRTARCSRRRCRLSPRTRCAGWPGMSAPGAPGRVRSCSPRASAG